MRKILQFLISGCWHQWEVEDQHSVARFNSVADYILEEAGVPAKRKIVATVDTLRCSKCKAVRYQKNNLPVPMKETL